MISIYVVLTIPSMNIYIYISYFYNILILIEFCFTLTIFISMSIFYISVNVKDGININLSYYCILIKYVNISTDKWSMHIYRYYVLYSWLNNLCLSIIIIIISIKMIIHIVMVTFINIVIIAGDDRKYLLTTYWPLLPRHLPDWLYKLLIVSSFILYMCMGVRMLNITIIIGIVLLHIFTNVLIILLSKRMHIINVLILCIYIDIFIYSLKMLNLFIYIFML